MPPRLRTLFYERSSRVFKKCFQPVRFLLRPPFRGTRFFSARLTASVRNHVKSIVMDCYFPVWPRCAATAAPNSGDSMEQGASSNWSVSLFELHDVVNVVSSASFPAKVEVRVFPSLETFVSRS